MYQRHLLPNQKVTVNKVKNLSNQLDDGSKSKHQTKITSSKKIIIQTNYQPLKSNVYRDHIAKTKSTYTPYEQIAKINRVNSQIQITNSKLLTNQIGNKQNDSAYFSKNIQNPSFQIIQHVKSNIKKLNIPNLYISHQDIYEGQFNEKQLFHGHGIYYFKACNVKYQGQFIDGQINGFGKLIYQNPVNVFPVIYQGNFRRAKKQGSGIYYYGNKNHFYDGQWFNDIKQGHGVYQSPEQFYEGFWAKNKKHGEGSLLNKKNNTQFNGRFYDDFFTDGSIKYSNGDLYIGSFHLGKKQGQGTYIYKLRNEEYKGQFSNDLRHGKGTLKMSNGDQFSGNFRHGRIDESLNCSYRWINGSVFKGWFKNGQPDKGTIKNTKQQQQYEYTSTASFINY